MDNKRIMVDIETMGNGPDAAIIAIGAVRFNLHGIYESFYDMISLESAVGIGSVIDPSTVIWWMRQSEGARRMFRSKMANPIRKALQDFSEWIGYPDTEIWGNGSDFDNVILASAYKKCGYELPWNFRYNRCYRTMKNMYPGIKAESEGVAHCAIDDAKNQARHLIEILKNTEWG